MKKQIKCVKIMIVLLICCLLSCKETLVANAEDILIDPPNLVWGDYEYWICNDEVEILKYTGTDGVVKIPNEIDGMKVTRIRGYFIQNMINAPSIEVKSVYIPANVKTIDRDAFYGCDIHSITVDEDNQTYNSQDNCNAIISTNGKWVVRGCEKTVLDQYRYSGKSNEYRQ